MSDCLIDKYDVQDSIDVIKREFPQFFHLKSHYTSMRAARRDLTAPSPDLVKALKNIFSFQRVIQRADKRVDCLIKVYHVHRCSQVQAARYTGIPLTTVGKITRENGLVNRAYKCGRKRGRKHE